VRDGDVRQVIETARKNILPVQKLVILLRCQRPQSLLTMLKLADSFILYRITLHNTFTQKFKSLLTEYPTVDIKAMDFPVGRHDEPLWR
jgi:hypothetical protein